MGEFIEAVANYERAFSMDNPDLGEDARSRQFLSFYQREMALYGLSRLDDPVAEYCVDRDLHPIFKVCAVMNRQCNLLWSYLHVDCNLHLIGKVCATVNKHCPFWLIEPECASLAAVCLRWQQLFFQVCGYWQLLNART